MGATLQLLAESFNKFIFFSGKIMLGRVQEKVTILTIIWNEVKPKERS